ncbi:MAG TPA: hypothetical protein VFR58_18325 [Flavisolibacter sp.]|nr:hypothetical protein [Flavisolibacter sp.]
MKWMISLAMILVTLAGFALSKKEKMKLALAPGLQGEWTGSYSIGNGPAVNLLIFDFGPNQSVKVYDGPKEWGAKAHGTYILEGDSLKARYRYAEGIQNEVVISARLSPGNKTLSGNWKWIKGEGSFSLAGTK